MDLSAYFIINSWIIKMMPYKSSSKNVSKEIFIDVQKIDHRDFITVLFLVENGLNVKQSLLCY